MPQRSSAWKDIAISIASGMVCAVLFAACGEPSSQQGPAPTTPASQVKQPARDHKAVPKTGRPEPGSAGIPVDTQSRQPADAAPEQGQLKACAMEAMEKCSVVLDDPTTHVACIKRNVGECTKTQ
jgi:hypothetical protein